MHDDAGKWVNVHVDSLYHVISDGIGYPNKFWSGILPDIYQASDEDLVETHIDKTGIAAPILAANEILKTWLAKHPEKVFTLTSRRFECLVADILRDLGFDVELTRATRDGGFDIYAYIRNQVSSFLMLVECKQWAPSHPVGIQVVQRLYGVQQATRANKSMIVTTSRFTKPAIAESRRYEQLMDLKDYNDFKGWLEKYR